MNGLVVALVSVSCLSAIVALWLLDKLWKWPHGSK